MACKISLLIAVLLMRQVTTESVNLHGQTPRIKLLFLTVLELLPERSKRRRHR
jgi:hypothetical protein